MRDSCLSSSVLRLVFFSGILGLTISTSNVSTTVKTAAEESQKPHFSSAFPANCSSSNESCEMKPVGILSMDSLMSHKTAFIVLTSSTLIIVAFFIIKFVRMRRKNLRKRKYDKRSSRGTSMEMRRLEEDDEEDDWTVFDATQGKPLPSL